MFRSIFIYLSKAAWARKIVTNWKFAWRAASRFVAGETLDDAIRVIQQLNQRGINATLDHLGEHTSSVEAAKRAAEEILQVLDSIQTTGVRANVSIKLTQIGLALDEGVCLENLQMILQKAAETNNFIRIDMEDSSCVDATLRLFRHMRHEQGFENVGIVIQSYLYRSEEVVRQLTDECAPIRLCKGAYKEPKEVAYPHKPDVDASYDRLAQIMMDGSRANGCPAISQDGRKPPTVALATHDERRVKIARDYARKIGLPKESLEFQMLHGIRRDLQESLSKEGYPVRIYVPYGSEWYPYFVRRLAERPANLWFFVSNFFRK
jgi:proline dehydrogenase